MGTTLLSIIGTLLVFLLGLILTMIRSIRDDIALLEVHVDTSLNEAKKEITDRVIKPDCIREMTEIKDNLKDAIKDIRNLERGK